MNPSARLLLGLLVLDAVLLAVVEVFFLPLRLGAAQGGVVLPLSVLLAAVTMPLLVRAAGRLAGPRLTVAGAPVAAWVLTVLVFGVAGPGGDVVLPSGWRPLLLMAAGILPAGVALGRLAARAAAPAAQTAPAAQAAPGGEESDGDR